MAAAAIATDDQLRQSAHAPTPRESLRERIARHLAGDAAPSNYEAMCRELVRRGVDARVTCPDCGGLGAIALPLDYLMQFEADLADDVKAWKLEIAQELDVNRQGVLRFNAEERERKRRALLNEQAVCRPCKGLGTLKNAAHAAAVIRARPDSMLTTVQCPRCTGCDARNERKDEDGERLYPTLLNRHYGSARTGQDCPDCGGDGYVEPITARPASRGSLDAQEPEGVETLPPLPRALHGRLHASPPPEDTADQDPEDEPTTVAPDAPDEARRFLADLARRDRELAAAAACYLGQHGDEWSSHAWGRRFALWPLLPAGRQLLDDAAGDETMDAEWFPAQLAALGRLRSEETQATGTAASHRRRALLTRADDQARRLERRVENALREAERSA